MYRRYIFEVRPKCSSGTAVKVLRSIAAGSLTLLLRSRCFKGGGGLVLGPPNTTGSIITRRVAFCIEKHEQLSSFRERQKHSRSWLLASLEFAGSMVGCSRVDF